MACRETVRSAGVPNTEHTFSAENVQTYCCYDPERDFRRCLREHRNAVPARWTRAEAELIRITDENAAPVIRGPLPQTSELVGVWDSWPIITRDASVAVLDFGWRVLIALTSPKTVLPGARHSIAKWGYFISKDGVSWEYQGDVFREGEALGARQWAGSTMVDDEGRVHFFYTASGRAGSPCHACDTPACCEQRIAYTSAELVVDAAGVRFEDFSEHQIILEPDGVLYQTLEQAEVCGGIVYAFRDPQWWKDPATGCEYLIFEGNVAGPCTDIDCGPGVPIEARMYTGNIGLALRENNSFTDWRLLPALLEATCTNQQTERPHIVVREGRYYLFTISHLFTYAPGLVPGPGPDGLYGFVSDSLRGEYVPLNQSGLVIANPPQNQFQAYSWLVLPDFTVTSFVDFYNLGGIPVTMIDAMPAAVQFNAWGGVEAPTLQLELTSRSTTRIIRELEFGLITTAQTESPQCILQRDETRRSGFCDNRPSTIC